LKMLRVDIDESCEFRNSNNSILGQIANVHTSDDRRHVVLTVGFKSDRYPHGVGARRLVHDAVRNGPCAGSGEPKPGAALR
jgi:hypothetical protein